MYLRQLPKKLLLKGIFYGPTINGTHPLEEALSQLEGKFSSTLSELQSKQNVIDLSAQSFLDLCGFLSLQYVRTKEVQIKVKEAGNNLLHYLLEKRFPDMPKETIKKIILTDMGVLMPQLRLIQGYHELANIFVQMKFVTIKNNTAIPFWTSDNPIALRNKTKKSVL